MPPKKSKKSTQSRRAGGSRVTSRPSNRQDAVSASTTTARVPRTLATKDLAAYALALSQPFHRGALGARVPDMYSYPTATYHAEGTIVVASTASGISSVCLTGNPFLSLLDCTNSSVNSTGMAAYGANAFAYAAVTLANLSAVLSNYRLVGGGFEIRNLLAPTATIGRLIVAKAPATGPSPGPTLLQGLAGLAIDIAPLINGIGLISSTIGYSSDLIELPEAVEYTVQDVITNALCINLKPVSPNAFAFHSSSSSSAYSASASMTAGTAYGTGTDTISPYPDSLSSMMTEGWDTVCLVANGLPASTTACFEIKYIYHFEGTPSLVTGAGTMVPASEPQTSIDPVGHMNILSKVLSSESIRLVSKLASAASAAYFTPGARIATAMAKLGLSL